MTFEATRPVLITTETFQNGKSFPVFFTTLRDVAATYNLLKQEVFDPLGFYVPEFHEIRTVVRHLRTSGRTIAYVQRNFSILTNSLGETQILTDKHRMRIDKGHLYRLTFNWQYWYRWRDFVVALAHEMVHLHQAYTYRIHKSDGHDRYFRIVSNAIAAKMGGKNGEYEISNRIQNFIRPFQRKIDEYRKKKKMMRMTA